jgi:hypothetical protein
MEVADRHLNYRQVVTTNLHSDESGPVLMPSIALDVFPFARDTTRVLQDIGIFGDFKRGLGSHKTLADGTKVPAAWTRFDVGIKYRIMIKRNWNAPHVALSLSYGEESYSFSPSAPPAEPLDIPSVDYQIIRPRIDARLPIGPIVILPGVGFLGILDSGDFVTKFRDPSVYGWEADLALAVPVIGKFLAVRGGIAYRRFVHQFSPSVGDAYIANVATDQMLRVDLGVSAEF